MIMQILKDLTLKVSGEKEILSLKLFVKRGNMSIISLEHAWKKKIVAYFHILLDVIKNRTEVQPMQITI